MRPLYLLMGLGAAMAGGIRPANIGIAAPQPAQTQKPAPAEPQQQWRELLARAFEGAQAGDVQKAAAAGEDALEFARRAFGPEGRPTIMSLLFLGQLYETLDEDGKAEPLLIEGYATSKKVFGTDDRVTFSFAGALGNVYFQTNREKEALPLLESAVRGLERSASAGDPATTRAMRGLVKAYRSEGRLRDAEPILSRLLDAESEADPGDEEAADDALDLADIYEQTARYSRAEPLLLKTVDRLKSARGDTAGPMRRAIHQLADLYLRQDRYGDAEPLLKKIISDMEARSVSTKDPDRIWALRSLSEVYRATGRTAEADATYERALLTDNDDVDFAQAAEWEGRYDLAEATYMKAVEKSRAVHGDEHPQTLEWEVRLARIYGLEKRPRDAEALYRKIVSVSEGKEGRVNPIALSGLAVIASAELERGEAASALADSRRAVGLISELREATSGNLYDEVQADRGDPASRPYFRLLADAAWVSAVGNDARRVALLPEAFSALQDAIDASPARAVAKAAARRASAEASSALGAMAAERQDLQDAWSKNMGEYRHWLSSSDPTADRILQRLSAEKSQIEARLAQIDRTLKKDFPQYFALIRPQPVELKDLQALLAPDEAMLLVVPTDLGTHLIALSRDNAAWVRSEWNQGRINAAVLHLLWDAGAAVDVDAGQAAQWQIEEGSPYAFDRKTAYELYRQIVAPVESVIHGKRHLFVVGGGSLSSLPFGILVTERPQGSDGDPAALRATRWLADAYALIQLPSVQSLQLLRRFNSQATAAAARPGGTFIGFGDPLLDGTAGARGTGRTRGSGLRAADLRWSATSSGTALADVTQIRKLKRLPGTALELENMATTLAAPQNSLFLRERATETNVKHTDLSNVRILALATHGAMAGELSGNAEPGLILSPPATPTAEDDGYLAASEIAELRLNADWVILSACNTAAGDGSQGAPGLSGLARAFFYAGARNLLVSHWPVRDDVAARLSVRTIQIERENPGKSRAEALQSAMAEIRNDPAHDWTGDTWAHPNAWAPFALVGDGAR